MDELAGRSAIVTGASRGIGAATAKELASQGVAVILAARTVNEIEAIAAEICDAEIGRASWRGRGLISVAAGSVNKKTRICIH